MPLPLSLPWSLRLLHVIALVVPILRLLWRWPAPWRLLLLLLRLRISGLRVVVVGIVPLLVMSVLVVAVLIAVIVILLIAVIVILLIVVVVVARVLLLLALWRVLLLALWRIPLVVVLLLSLHGHGGGALSSIVLSKATFGRVYQVRVVLRIAPSQPWEAACFKEELGRNCP